MQSNASIFQDNSAPTGRHGRDVLKGPLLITALFWFAFQSFLAARLEPTLMMLSGKLAAFYRSSDLYWDQAAFWILPLADFDLRVTTACSGVTFYGMLCTLALWLYLAEEQYRHSLRPLLTVPLYALVITLLLNGTRIHLAGETYFWFHNVLSAGWQMRAHLLLGIIIFLPALIFWFFIHAKKWTSHE